MKPDSKLAKKIDSQDFFVTAEYLPRAEVGTSVIEASKPSFGGSVVAVNVSDNHYGVGMSSLAASALFSRAGIEPVYQIVTRDRNRMAIQSDLLGAASLGIQNVLCLSGYHQSTIGSPESANVFDIDSIQLIATVRKMNDAGMLLDGTKIEGAFSMLAGAAINPFMKPLELNLIRLTKKVDAGARFIQTQAVFEVEAFQKWLEAVHKERIADKVAILAGVLPLASAAEARKLSESHTDFNIPASIIERLAAAGSAESQKKEGVAICVEIIKKIRGIRGLRGIHILSGGNEKVVPEIISASGL
jgi:methylenetetrahydrofolate reductase (NADPH)